MPCLRLSAAQTPAGSFQDKRGLLSGIQNHRADDRSRRAALECMEEIPRPSALAAQIRAHADGSNCSRYRARATPAQLPIHCPKFCSDNYWKRSAEAAAAKRPPAPLLAALTRQESEAAGSRD